MRMFGGSPMSVLAPPMLLARISLTMNGQRTHAHPGSQEEGDRSDQHDGRHVVEKRAGDRGDHAQDDEDAVGIAASEASGPHRHPAEDARLPDDRGEDHHPRQQEDHVEVDLLERLLLADDPEEDHGDPARHRRDGLVDALGRDQGVGENEDREADDHRRRHRSLSWLCGSRSPSRPVLRTQTSNISSWST